MNDYPDVFEACPVCNHSTVRHIIQPRLERSIDEVFLFFCTQCVDEIGDGDIVEHCTHPMRPAADDVENRP
jgi:hypothetical protein